MPSTTLELICICSAKVTRRESGCGGSRRESRCSFTWLRFLSAPAHGATGWEGGMRKLDGGCRVRAVMTPWPHSSSPYLHCHASLSPPLASAWLVSIPLLTFWPRIPFFCFKAGSRLHYSIFIFPSSLFLFTQLCPQKKSCLSLAWWIIIPSSVSPCQSINLTCHLLSFLSSSVKGWPPLLSLYLSVSLCVQIPRLSPPDWIIQFRCHLFHSWQWGLCALSSV